MSAGPAYSRTYARCTVLIPLATLPAQPRYWRCTPAVAVPVFSWPVSSSAPITRPPFRPPRRAASSSPATANRRTTPIAANVSHTARLSSRCARSGARSPACSAIVHPLRFGSPLTSAPTYLPACSHGSVRAKHGPSATSSSRRFRAPRRAPILAAAAASDFAVLTNCMIARRLPRTPTRDQLQPLRNYPQLKAPMAAALLGCCVERLRPIAESLNLSIAQLAVARVPTTGNSPLPSSTRPFPIS